MQEDKENESKETHKGENDKRENGKKFRIPGLFRDPVLIAAWVLAALSVLFVHPDQTYLDYIDWRSLGILWSLMVVIQGFKKNKVFDWLGRVLLKRVSKGWQLAAVLIFLCFFLSMLITNDVALITFVPFAILILTNCGMERMILPVVVLQTVAANLGSMLTPVGNPQNLYLYGLSGMSAGEFVGYMLPLSLVSGGLLILTLFFLPQKREMVSVQSEPDAEKTETGRGQILVYLLLFLLALAVVLRLVPWYVLAICVFLIVLAVDAKILMKADYTLLLTFIGFFIFTGNIGRIPQISGILREMMEGREVIAAVLASQCISNVPAALLLSGFTSDYPALLAGVNIGGLGTLIASMASLISYKAFAGAYEKEKGRYLGIFSAVNLVFLVILLGFYGIVS